MYPRSPCPERRTKRGADRTPLGGDYDVADLRRELRGARRGPRAARRARPDRGPLRGRRAPDLGVRGADGVDPRARARGLDEADLRPARGPHPARHVAPGRCRSRSPRSTTRACASSWTTRTTREFETAKVDGRTGFTRAHGPRRPVGAADRGRARLAPRPRRGGLPAARRAALARPRGAPARVGRRPRALDRPLVRAGGLRLELPREGRAAHRRGLVRPALPREGADGAARRGPRRGRRPLPGQLDPPQDPPGGRRRHLLRRRLGRALPAADRRGNPHRLVLRHRVRPRAAARDRRGRRRATRRSHATARSASGTPGSSTGCCARSAPCRACRRGSCAASSGRWAAPRSRAGRSATTCGSRRRRRQIGLSRAPMA